MEFSPPKHPPKRPQRSKWFDVELPASPDDDDQEKNVLILKPFSAVPHISFHKVKVGCTKSCDLYIYNPLDISQIVRIEKVPTDKGFYVEKEEYSLDPGEEKLIKIFWTPDKVSSYRETVVFKTSTGCKTHAYLLGTSFLPIIKVSQKTAPLRNKRQLKKKTSPKIAKTSSALPKSAPVFDGLKFCEEKKENLDFLNSKHDPFTNKPNHAFFKCTPKVESRASFCLKSSDEFPDSPIRRQTYTINSMLLNGRESEVLPFPLNESCNNIKINNTWKRSQNESTTGNYKHENALNPLLTKLSNEDNLNDSLENTKEKGIDIGVHRNYNDSLSEIDSNYELPSFDNPYMRDCVKTYDIVNKHLYFGYTPQQSERDEASMVSRQFKCSNNTEILPSMSKKSAITPNMPDLTETKMNFVIPTYNFDTYGSFSDSNFDMTNIIPEFDKNNYPFGSFSINDVSYRYPISNDTVLTAQLNKCDKKCLEKPYEIKNENFYKSNTAKEFAGIDDESFNLQQKHDASKQLSLIEENLVEDYINGKVLKKTETAVCMEFPNDPVKVNSTASSKFSKASKKQSVYSLSTGNAFKKSQKSSPLKKKIVKSRSVTTTKDSSLKSLPATSKAISGVGNKENLSKRLPRKLCLVKPKRISDVLYQRNPFASMNIYYDERWIEKQEAAFTTWLNFILTPNDDFSSEDVKVDSAKLWIESIKETSSVPAPTKEELSLKAYTATKNLNALRKASFSLYQSDNIVPVIKKIEREVDLKKINIRKDRAVHADLGIKKDILEMLLSYNTLWLRIGLETVYGEIITLQNNSDVLGLSRFIVHRFLNNPEIAAKYLHPGVLNYYRKGYEDEIQRFILKKFLLLVFFLDTAKNVHLIKHNPCLFNKNSKFKSSRSLLLAFSRDYLSGEGDITKHLRYLGCKVSYEQSALEEFDFSVRNLTIDLRCGLRLGRVVELLLQDWTISQNLRINTLNRLTKIHNNDVILKALKNACIEIDNNIEAKHIVDGYREKTLDLLWQIIFKTQISKLINKDLLKRENAFLNRSLKLRADFAAYNALRKHEYSSNQQEIAIGSMLYKENEILRLLLQWCQSVCAHYAIRVHNFTSSFSDGRVLCLLLHHYHPNVLPYECIKFETTSSYFDKQMELAETNDDCPFILQNGQPNNLIDKLKKNEQDNLALVFQKFQEVGHIPILSCPSDMSNTMPDEKVTITLVSYVNIRLMELSIEIRAARKILHAWKKYKLRKQHESLKTEINAVILIQKTWRKYLDKKNMEEKNKAAIKMQTFGRMHLAKKKLMRLKEEKMLALMNKSVIYIQALFRGYLVRKRLSKNRIAAIIIQAYFRRSYARTHFIKLKRITCRIQQNFRAKVAAQVQRSWFITLCQNVIKLQAYSRGLLVRRQQKKKLISAVKIQAYIRMWLARKKYHKMRSACIIIQQKFRGFLLTEFYSQEYQNHRSAAISIQKWYRTVKIQQHKTKCIIKVQAFVRSFITRKKYLALKRNAIRIQSWWRSIVAGKKARLAYVQTYQSIICIQSFIRQCIASQKYRKQKQSAIVIQKYIRAFITKRRYCRMKRNATLIQNLWRSRCLTNKTRSAFLSYRKKVIAIQSVIRRFIAVCIYRRIKRATISIQKNVRTFLLRKRFCKLKSSTIYIQRKWRAIILARVTRASFLVYRKTVILVQSFIRKKIAYQSFKTKKHSAIIIQKMFRMFIQRKQYLNLKRSVSLIKNRWQNILLGRQMRREFLRHKKAATAIQSLYRMYYCRRNFILLKKAVCAVEHYRIGKLQRNNYLKIKRNTVKLQSLFRAYLCKKHYLKSVKNVILIQACIKRYIARRQYLKIKSSVIKIQEFYRAYRLKCAEKQKFLQIRNCIIKLQAIFRGRCVRKHLQVLNKNATLIQIHYKRWKAQSEYKRLKQSCLIVQRRYRANVEMKQQYQNYIKIRNCVIIIQAFVRGYLMRKQYMLFKMSVIKIQSYVRMIKCYRTYQKIKLATRMIEQYYKSYMEMKAVRNDYLKIKSQITYLQSKVRSFIVRKIFLREKRACILLQSFIRMKLQQRKYLRIYNTIIFVQRYYRNQKVMKLQKACYTQQRQSVIYLQSKVRCMIARKKYLQRRRAIIFLQSIVRSMIARKIYLQKRSSIIHLQSKVRSIIARKKYLLQRQSIIHLQSKVKGILTRKKYLHQKQSAIYLQSKIRSMIARKNYLKRKKACIFIQAFLRMWIQKKKYRSICNAAVFVQRYYKNQRIMKLQRSAFIQQRNSVIILQSYIRCMIARKKYLRLKNACILIQSHVRMYLQRKQFLKIKNASLCLQKQYRSWKHMKVQCMKKAAKAIQMYYRNWKKMKFEQNVYLEKRKAVLFLQSKFRSILARRNYLKQRRFCIIIQSYCRMFIQKKKYKEIHKTIIFLQRYYRNCCLTKIHRQAFIVKRNAAIYLQSKIRCFIIRRRFLKQKDACILVQSFVRMFIEKTRYNKTRKATIVIQKSFKNYQLSIELRKKFLTLCKACITVQSYFRMYKCRKEFLKLRSATLYIQQKYRAKCEAYKAKQQFMVQKTACIKIQSYVRMVLAVKLFLKYRNSSIKIQSKYRSYVARKNYIQLKNATLTLQRYFAAWKMKIQARCKFFLLKQSAITVQTAIRRYISQKNFQKKRNAALTLQKYVRAYMIGKKIHKQYVYRRKCIILAQASVRGFLARNNLRKLHISAIKIQTAYRGHVVRMDYIRQQKSAVIIQRYFRSVLLMRKLRQEYAKIQISTVIIQSTFRCYKDRKEFLRKKKAIVVLQAHARKCLCQKKFNKLKRSVQVIESRYLAYKAGLSDYALHCTKKRSCMKIQACWRAYALKKKVKTQIEAAVKIQRAFRSCLQKKTYSNMKSLLQNQKNLPVAIVQRLWYLYLRRSVIHFQRAARTFLLKRHKAAIVIQSHFRRWKIQKQYKELKAAVRIQSCWKGYLVRRSITNKKIIEARKRIKAADSSEPNKLKNRTSRSLDLLFEDSRISSIMEALKELDVCTKLSPRCCERLVASGGLTILIQFVSVCNRSIPHMEIIKVVTNILLNLAKYDKTVDYVWETKDSLVTILRLMKTFREKGITIFNKCLSLLSIFCQDPAKVEIMKSKRDLTEEIRSFHYLLKRKQNFEKQHIAKSLSGSSFLNRTLSSKSNLSVLQRDSIQIEPDWMLGGNRCREFNDPVIGISWLMKVLDLKSK